MKLNFIFDLLFPSVCAACAKRVEREESLCKPCASKLNFYRTFFCGRCGARLPAEKKICHLDHPYVLGAAMNYHEPQVESLIKSLKFGRSKKAALFLAKILGRYASPLLEGQNFLIIPIPLGEKRLRERGFNQAELIARCLAANLNLTLKPALRRIKETPPQSGIRGHRERLNNVSGAFVAEQSIVAGQNILLIDDVTTSGATFYEAAAALKSAGARKIIALAAAKA
jgi:ComF family protein